MGSLRDADTVPLTISLEWSCPRWHPALPHPDTAPSTLSLARGTRHPLLPRDELPPTGMALSRLEGRSNSPGGAVKAGNSPVLTAHGSGGRAAPSGSRGRRDTSSSERNRPLPLPATHGSRRHACAGPWPYRSPPAIPSVLCGQRDDNFHATDGLYGCVRFVGSCSPALLAILMWYRTGSCVQERVSKLPESVALV